MVNAVTQRYIDECMSGSGGLRYAVQRAPFTERFREAYGSQLMDRPWFVEDRRLKRFSDDLSTFLDLLLSLPERLFAGDLHRYCAALGIDDRRAAIMIRGASDRPARYARPDVYDDGESFKLLEFNICSALGGLDHAAVNSSLMRLDEFRDFAEAEQLDYTDTAREFARALHKVADPVAGNSQPVVAMVEWKGGMAGYINRCRVFQDVMADVGIDVRLAEVDQLTTRNGKLHHDDVPIDVVLRYFSVNQICSDPDGEAALEPILRAHDAGTTVLYTPLESYLYSNKGALALLSDPRWRSEFSTAESALIDRVMPWTRLLVAGPTQLAGDYVDLVDYCRDHRDRLILKPRAGFGGIGTVAGWDASEHEWHRTLEDLSGSGYIVQERVDPQPEPVCGAVDGNVANWIAAWSFFFTEEGYAGSSFLRAIPADAGTIISPSTKPRMKTGSVFTYPSTSV